jgi:phosphonate degradation associated HDIG domain protein
MNVADEIVAIFQMSGSAAYFGESVSMLEHALQAAHFAAVSGAPPELVLAALLHDIGHLVEEVPDDIAEWTTDAQHEKVGSLWLRHRFQPEVSEPVRLHVPAKRYLLATDPAYLAKLSPASVLTLKLQGGPMTPDESALFESERFHKEAVRVRQWDDQGKVVGLQTPGLEHYRRLIDALAI